MQDGFRKKSRLGPVIRASKAQLDNEQIRLAKIRSERIAAVSSVRTSHERYLAGVEQLNQLRKSGDMRNLLSLERGLDSTKNQLLDNVKEANYREQKEREQITLVVEMQSKLKSLENLLEKKNQFIKKSEEMREQKELDELSSGIKKEYP